MRLFRFIAEIQHSAIRCPSGWNDLEMPRIRDALPSGSSAQFDESVNDRPLFSMIGPAPPHRLVTVDEHGIVKTAQ